MQKRSAFRQGFAAALSGLAMVMAMALQAAEPVSIIVVEAGDQERPESLVNLRLPPGQFPASTWLRESATRNPMIPIQIDPDGEAWFVVRGLKAGERRSYQVEARLRIAAPSPTVQATRNDGDVRLTLDGKSVFTYHSLPTPLPRTNIPALYQRGGYIHPVYTPAGARVTEDYPTNHIHHHGIWTAWTKTEFHGRHPDFWNMGEGKGRVEPVALDQTWSGPIHGGFKARHQSVDLLVKPGEVAVRESWTARLFSVGTGARQYHLFELEMTHTSASDEPLKLVEHLYGGLGVRGNAAWHGPRGLKVLTALEERDRVKAHATRSPWYYMGGLVDGQTAGISILGHPDNFRAPQAMRVHPDEPFFCYAPVQSGAFEISKDSPYRARYRFVVTDGEPDSTFLNQLWFDFAHPVKARFEEATTNAIQR